MTPLSTASFGSLGPSACDLPQQSTDNLVGGSYNGLINFFDLRKPGATVGHAVPLETSVIEKSHHDPVYDVFWISSKTGSRTDIYGEIHRCFEVYRIEHV